MGDQHIHIHTGGGTAVKSTAPKATLSEMCKTLVIGSAVVAGKAKRLKGGISVKASGESGAMQDLVTGPESGMSSILGEVQRSMRGEAQPETTRTVSASDVGSAAPDPKYIAKQEAVLRDPKADPEARQTAGEVVTKARLTAGVLGMAPVRKSTAADMPKLIGRLEDILKSGQPLKDLTKQEIGQTITAYRLEQGVIAGEVSKIAVSQLNSVAEDERLASIASIRAAQTRPAISGTPSVSADDQIRSIVGDGKPMSLGEVQSLGNGGYLSAGGRTEPDPVVVAQTLSDELSKSTDPRRRAELGEMITYLNLVRGVNSGSRVAA